MNWSQKKRVLLTLMVLYLMITGIGLFFILRPKQTKSDTIVTEKNTLIKESLKQNTLMKVDKIIESLETAE